MTLASGTWEVSEDNIFVSLTHSPLCLDTVVDKVRSPEAGAIVLFAGNRPGSLNLLKLMFSIRVTESGNVYGASTS